MMLGGEPGVTDQPATSLLYSGEQFDPELGWNYQRARYYDMGVGRWNRVDPFGGNHGDPQSLHKYAYAHANPVCYSDPSGLLSVLELAAVGILTLAVTYLYLRKVKKVSPLTSLLIAGMVTAITVFMLVNAPLIAAGVAATLAAGGGKAILLVAAFSAAAVLAWRELRFMTSVLMSPEATEEEKLVTLAMMLNTILLLSVFARALDSPPPVGNTQPVPSSYRTFYRVMDRGEYQGASNSGLTVRPGSSAPIVDSNGNIIPGKFAWGTHGHAQKWQAWLASQGETDNVIVPLLVPDEATVILVDTFGDYIGPSFFIHLQKEVNIIVGTPLL